MIWSNAYIGIPYVDQGRDMAGVDCWGLARLVYGRELGITLPSYTEGYTTAEEAEEVAKLIASQATVSWGPIDEARPFDLLLFRQGRHGSHIGIAVTRRLMLHVARGDQSKVEPFAGNPIWSRRFVGAYRHATLEARACPSK